MNAPRSRSSLCISACLTLLALAFSSTMYGQGVTAPTVTLTTPSSDLSIPYGGHHEFSVIAGYSFHAGPALGYVRNTQYGLSALRYSFKIRGGKYYNLRYAPEVTTIAMLYEPAPSQINPEVPIRHYGGGFSPVDFEEVFLPTSRTQPFIMIDGGLLYYNGRVLSPGGTQLMFTVDYGIGVKYFVTRRNAMVFEFRYQHQSNANIGEHNPGADGEIFYLGFSHFHTRGVK